MTELLLLSNSTSAGLGFLEHALDTIAGLVRAGQRLLFVPFASGDRPGPGDRGGRRGLYRRRQLVRPAPGTTGDRPARGLLAAVRGGAAAVGGTTGARLFAGASGERERGRASGRRWLAGKGAGAPGAGPAVQRGAQQPGFRRPCGTGDGGRSRRTGRCGPGEEDSDHGRDLLLGRMAAHDAQPGRRSGIGVVRRQWPGFSVLLVL